MLQILAGPDLTHEPILVPVHTCELTNMVKRILQAVGKLVRIDV